MKSSINSILLTVLLTSSFILIQSGCEKENTKIDDYGDPVVSTTGEATVGKAGGTISIGDETSAIYGASIEMPRDAVNEDVTITIVPGDEELINGIMVQTVDFLPKGLEFSEQVEIGIPWTTDDQNSSNSKIYYLDEENSNIESLVITSVDTENKITYGLTNHFSPFFNERQYYLLDYALMKKGNQFMAYVNLYTPLVDILPKLNDSPYANAQEIVTSNNGMQDCFAQLSFSLWKKDKNREHYIKQVARQDFYIKYNETAEGWNAYVYRYDNPRLISNQAVEIFHKSGLTYEQLKEDWLSGFPIVASFSDNCFWDANFTYDDDDMFEGSVNWKLTKQYKPIYSSQVWTWGFGKYSGLKTFSELESYIWDENNNNIEDIYEGDNNPPGIPLNPQPVNYATNVSTNTNLSWSCSDPDGDDLIYKIYFGASSSPPLVGTTENSTVYTPSGLTENTTYFWYIEATDPGDLTSTSQVWEFTTESSGGNPCDGITSVNYEGQTYNTIEIGEQCWFKENLNVGTRIDGSEDMSDNNTIEKYCYNDEPDSCNIYGGLYQWDEVMQYTTAPDTQGICPDGWHIPTNDEFLALTTFLGGYSVAGGKIKETGFRYWNSPNQGATNESGFTALGAGYRVFNGFFRELGNYSQWWTTEESSGSNARIWYLLNTTSSIYQSSMSSKKMGISVRCIKD